MLLSLYGKSHAAGLETEKENNSQELLSYFWPDVLEHTWKPTTQEEVEVG